MKKNFGSTKVNSGMGYVTSHMLLGDKFQPVSKSLLNQWSLNMRNVQTVVLLYHCLIWKKKEIMSTQTWIWLWYITAQRQKQKKKISVQWNYIWPAFPEMPSKNPLINSVGYEVMLDRRHRTARSNNIHCWIYLLTTQDYWNMCWEEKRQGQVQRHWVSILWIMLKQFGDKTGSQIVK